MLIDYDLLKTLLEIVETATFAEAARRRRITPSAVSQQVKALEGQLGVPLFERIGRRARLTPAGRWLVSALRPHFISIEDALTLMTDDQKQVRGPVRLGGPAPFCRMWLRPRIVKLMKEYPALTLEVIFQVPSLLEQRLQDGQLDLAILVRPSESKLLHTHLIHTEEFVAVASPAYVRKHGTPETASEFMQHRFIVFDEDLPMHRPWWQAHFGRRDVEVSIACRVASLDEMLALALGGVAVAVLPSYFVDDAVKKEQLVVLDAAGRRGPARNPIYLAWRKGAIESTRFVAVRSALLG